MKFSIYLSFNGNCAEAMNFYKDALQANLVSMQRYGDTQMPHDPSEKDLVMHSVVEKDGFEIMGSDGNGGENRVRFGNNSAITINFDSEEDINRSFAALSEGGAVTMPLGDTFWGAKFGMCTDKFGNCWMFNYYKQQGQ